MNKIKPQDHPDYVGGWVWTKLELDWINERIGTLEAALFQMQEAAKQPAAQRPFVGLTDEERGQAINANFGTGLWRMAKDIEAKLKEKNT